MTLEKQLAEGEYFKVHDGPVLPSLLALRAYLRMAPQQQFAYHVAKNRNDFALWVEHVFGETDLAKRMSACTTREEMVWLLDDAFSESRMRSVIAGKEPEHLMMKQVPHGVEVADDLPLQEDAAFDRQKAGIVATNERISAKYDDVAKHLQEALANPVPREIEQRIDALRTRQQEMLLRISEARKSRHDALIPALIMRQFPSKLSMAIATREEKDFALAQSILDEADAELKEILGEPIIDVKAEVLALAGIEGKK